MDRLQLILKLQTLKDREHTETKKIDECTMRTNGSPFGKKQAIPTLTPLMMGAMSKP